MQKKQKTLIITGILLLLFVIGTWIPHQLSRTASSNQFLGCMGVTTCYNADVSQNVWELLTTESLKDIHYGASGDNFPLFKALWRALLVKRSVIVDGPEFDRNDEKQESYIDYNSQVSGNSYWRIQDYTFFNIPIGPIQKVRVGHA